jgi:membrane associated rhomboid family serine protease
MSQDELVANCTRHQTVETYLSCTSCNRPFCYECLIPAAVGSKCGECAKGRVVGSTDTAKGRATVVASEFSANRLAPLWIVLGVVTAANVAMFVASGPTSPLSGIDRFSLSTDAIKFEWWRLFTGSVAHQSLISLAINLAATWWIGRFLSPRLRLARFLALAMASMFGGALVCLLLVPHGATFGGLALSGGMVGAQLAGQRRGSLGRLMIPRMQNVGFVGWFALWFLFSSLFSGLGSLGAIVGGLAVGFGLGWLMLERTTLMPNQADPNEVRHGAIGAAVAVACALLAIGLAGGSGSVATAQKDLDQNQDIARVPKYTDVFTQGEPMGGLPNVFQVTKLDYQLNSGAKQWFLLTCDDSPNGGGDTDIDVGAIAGGACTWIEENADRLASFPEEKCTGAAVSVIKLQGKLADGRDVRAIFETSEELGEGELSQPACGTEFSKAAHVALWG